VYTGDDGTVLCKLNLSTISKHAKVWSASCSSLFTSDEGASDTQWTRSWVGPRACQDVMGKRKKSLTDILTVVVYGLRNHKQVCSSVVTQELMTVKP
jgi:hypothetical protein